LQFGVAGLIRHFRTQAFDAFVVFDGAAVLAIGIDLLAAEKSTDIGLDGHLARALSGGVVAVLRAGDFDVAIAEEVCRHGTEGLAGGVEGVIESDGEEAGFETIAAEDGLLAERDALDGEEFLGVGGAVAGDRVGFEVRDFVEFFEAHNGEGRAAEGVLDERVFGVQRGRVDGAVDLGHGLRDARLHSGMRGEGWLESV
jgi:hypothetical protein